MHRAASPLVLAVVAALAAEAPSALAAQHSVPQEFASIQAAINGAQNGDVILVMPGTYEESIDFLGKAITVRSVLGAAETTIDAGGAATSTVKCVSGEGPQTVLDGFTIRGGRGTFEDLRRKGGGMYNLASSPTVRNCVFRANTIYAYEFEVSGSGGGMYNEQSDPLVEGCVFEDNQLLGCSGWLNGGAGMYNEASSPMVVDCVFRNNHGNNGGGMMIINDSHPALANCVFDGNEATFSGGGLNATDGSTARLVNCTFTANAAYHGAGLYVHSGHVEMTNCTVAFNTAQWRGAGLYALFHATASSVANSIFHGNELYWPDMPPGTEGVPGDDEKEIAYDGGPAPAVFTSIVEGGWSAGSGIMDIDPAFANPAAGDLRLAAGSPAVDAGLDGAVPADETDLDEDGNYAEAVPHDLDHSDRFAGAAVDLGAFEATGGGATCAADISGPGGPGHADGLVNALDMLLMMAQWGGCTGCEADVAGPVGGPDGQVNALDMLTLLGQWGACP